MSDPCQETTRILVVEGDRTNLFHFGTCLQEAGHRVVSAESAQPAEIPLQGCVFDLCFLTLPLFDPAGEETFPALHQIAPWMWVVFVVASNEVDSASTAMRAGATDYLIKPCSPQQLRLAAEKQIHVRRLEKHLEELKPTTGSFVSRIRTANARP